MLYMSIILQGMSRFWTFDLCFNKQWHRCRRARTIQSTGSYRDRRFSRTKHVCGPVRYLLMAIWGLQLTCYLLTLGVSMTVLIWTVERENPSDLLEPSALLNVGGFRIQDNAKQTCLAAFSYHYAIFDSTWSVGNISHVARNPVFGVSNQVRHNQPAYLQNLARCLKTGFINLRGYTFYAAKNKGDDQPAR